MNDKYDIQNNKFHLKFVNLKNYVIKFNMKIHGNVEKKCVKDHQIDLSS